MITRDPAGAVLAVASSYIGLTEQGGDNCGQVVEWFLKTTGLGKGYPWCMSFVTHCGVHGLMDIEAGKTAWPLPKTAACAAAGKFAATNKVLETRPVRGDIMLLYYPKLGRFAHAGLIIGPDPAKDGAWLTYEGNTSGGGSRNGWGAFRRSRTFGPRDRFVRWSELLDR
jgi:hypothetical protein